MAANNNPQALRMIDAITEVAGDEAAAEFTRSLSLSKSADFEKKFEWAKGVCEYLDEKFDSDCIMRIRQRCFCNDGKSAADRMKKYIKKTDSIKEFTELFNKSEKYGWLEYISEHRILMCYPECYCSCVKRVDEKLSRTWCLCTVGYAKNLFGQVFDKEIRAELIESVKTGADRCAVSIEW